MDTLYNLNFLFVFYLFSPVLWDDDDGIRIRLGFDLHFLLFNWRVQLREESKRKETQIRIINFNSPNALLAIIVFPTFLLILSSLLSSSLSVLLQRKNRTEKDSLRSRDINDFRKYSSVPKDKVFPLLDLLIVPP